MDIRRVISKASGLSVDNGVANGTNVNLCLVFTDGDIIEMPSRGCWGVFDLDLKDLDPKKHILYMTDYPLRNYNYYCHGNRTPMEKRADKAWVNWVVNQSPWAPVHARKDVRKIFEKGTVLNTCFPIDFIKQANWAVRALSYRVYTIPVWYDAVKRGMNPCLSVFFACEFHYNHEGFCKSPYYLTDHDVFSYYKTRRKHIKAFSHYDYSHVNNLRPFSVENSGYELYHNINMWGGTNSSYLVALKNHPLVDNSDYLTNFKAYNEAYKSLTPVEG